MTKGKIDIGIWFDFLDEHLCEHLYEHVFEFEPPGGCNSAHSLWIPITAELFGKVFGNVFVELVGKVTVYVECSILLADVISTYIIRIEY